MIDIRFQNCTYPDIILKWKNASDPVPDLTATQGRQRKTQSSFLFPFLISPKRQRKTPEVEIAAIEISHHTLLRHGRDPAGPGVAGRNRTYFPAPYLKQTNVEGAARINGRQAEWKLVVFFLYMAFRSAWKDSDAIVGKSDNVCRSKQRNIGVWNRS